MYKSSSTSVPTPKRGGGGDNDCANKGNPPTQELAPRGTESHHWIGGAGPLATINNLFCKENCICFCSDMCKQAHGKKVYLMNQNNSFLLEKALYILLVSVNSILLDFLFIKLSKI